MCSIAILTALLDVNAIKRLENQMNMRAGFAARGGKRFESIK